MADRILNFSQPLDCQFLDSTVHTFYNSKSTEEVRDCVVACLHPRHANRNIYT